MKFVANYARRGARVLRISGDECIVAQGYSLGVAHRDGVWRQVARISVPMWEEVLASFALTRLALRFGIHAALPLDGGDFLVVLKRRIIKVTSGGETILIDRIHRGNKPASRGVCRCPDGVLLYGEYTRNRKRTHPVAVYRTEDIDSGFQKVFEFSPAEVAHIHFLQWDPFEQCIWMGTGDADSECRLYKSADSGLKWACVGGGEQIWRAIGVAFTEEAIFWGTDSGYDTGQTRNFIVRMDRKTRTIRTMQQVQGPCHGIGVLANGKLCVSTGVEGGENEVDRLAHLWVSEDGSHWEEVYALRKNWWRPFDLQFGVMRIPPGTETTSELSFTALGLQGANETWIRGEFARD
jgi:hypothetical protein